MMSLVTTHRKMAEEIEFSYFARVDDSAFWADRERVKTLIELYTNIICVCGTYV